jgi:hypothetical protein
MDWQQDGYPDIIVGKACIELLKNKKPLKKIIVVFVDCGLKDTIRFRQCRKEGPWCFCNIGVKNCTATGGTLFDSELWPFSYV